ncbi:MAG TPA: MBL fold metallo-hydrolase [Gammaproteobacteria bacterium]|jgi:glyoxylase-like metal-dependent hydrolase (beta-lactamase superfamily II)
MSLDIAAFFHAASSTYSYVVADGAAKHAAVIDPALDYDAASGRTGTASAQKIVEHLKLRDYAVDWILETHAHADHLSAAQFIKQASGGRAKVAIGEGIREVQTTFKTLYNLGQDFTADGKQFDHLFKDGETFKIGELPVQVLAMSGHTSDGVAYLLEDAAFVGDSLFMPDSGTARCDFPGGDAGKLHDSVRRLLDLPEATRLFMCHDYAPGGREHRNQTTVEEERRSNIHVKDGVSREDFIKLRQGRDATLPVPALLLPAIQVNIRAGRFPEPDANGVVYLRIPVDRF